MPGDEGYEAYLAFEAQQFAFWNSYSARETSFDEAFPDLAGMRTDAGLLREVQQAARAENRAAAAKLRAIANCGLRRMANPEVGYDEKQMKHSAEAEVGVMLGVTPTTASHWMELAMALTRRLPKTFAALDDGAISLPTARMIKQESDNLNVAQCGLLEDAVLPKAAGRTTSSLQATTRRQVEKLDAEAVRKRREKAAAERTLYLQDEPDGMATLCALLPADQARACFNAIDALVHPKAAGEQRRVGTRRADALVDLIAAATGTDPRAAVVTAPAEALTAQQIADLNRGAEVYTPRPALKAAIRRRDKHCRFPGCRRPAMRCDLDHTLAFPAGKTVYENLAALCRFHHQIKQMPGWHCEQDRHGWITWTTPTGARFVTRPPPHEGDDPPDFLPPEALEDEFPF